MSELALEAIELVLDHFLVTGDLLSGINDKLLLADRVSGPLLVIELIGL